MHDSGMVPSSASGPVEDAGEVAGDLFLACGRLTRAAARLNRTGDPSAVWRAMATLEEAGPLRVSEFAEWVRCSQPTATTTIKRLEESGLTQRTADPEDGRAWLVSITAEGRSRLAELRTRTTELIRQRIGDDPAVGREEILGALHVLTRLTDMINGDHHPDPAAGKKPAAQGTAATKGNVE